MPLPIEQSSDSDPDRRITFVVNTDPITNEQSEEESEDDEEFLPVEDTYFEDDDDNDDNDEEQDFTDNETRSPPPYQYHRMTRASLSLSLASMLNNLSTSTSLTSHLRLTVLRNLLDQTAPDDEINRRWRLLRRCDYIWNSNLQTSLNKKTDINISDTIFQNHFNSHHSAFDNLIGLRKFDSVLTHRQNLTSATPQMSKKRHFQDSDSSSDQTTKPQQISFIQPGVTFQLTDICIKFLDVNYSENVVNGVIYPEGSCTASQFLSFTGVIVDFIDHDLRYSTVHSNNFSSESSLLTDHNNFVAFKKQLDKWFKLPPFNTLQSKKIFEKILTCNNCLNTLLQKFVLLKLTVMIRESSSNDIVDNLQLLISVDRLNGELYLVSGELDNFQRCSSCNVIHHDQNFTSTGNSIIDKLLILNNDENLEFLRPLLINLKLLEKFQSQDNVIDENVWKDSRSPSSSSSSSSSASASSSSTSNYVSNKRLKKNDNQFFSKKTIMRKSQAFKNDDVYNYKYDELFVSKFLPSFKDSRFNLLNVTFS